MAETERNTINSSVATVGHSVSLDDVSEESPMSMKVIAGPNSNSMAVAVVPMDVADMVVIDTFEQVTMTSRSHVAAIVCLRPTKVTSLPMALTFETGLVGQAYLKITKHVDDKMAVPVISISLETVPS